MAAAGRVITGFSKPYVAKYSASAGTVTYSEGMVLARGENVDISAEVGDASPFYADNTEAENVPGVFTGGTVTLTVDGLLDEANSLIFGLPEPESVSYGTSKTADVYDYGDNMQIPYVGIGFIVRYMSGGETSYVPMVLTKASFNTPSVSAATQEESIEFQPQKLTADLMRDDSTNHKWFRQGEGFATEAEAEELLKALLNIQDTQSLQTMAAKNASVKKAASAQE